MSYVIGGALSASSLIFLILGIMTIVERGRFSPFYTPVTCTNANIQIPFAFATYPGAPAPGLPNFMYFDDINDFIHFNATTGLGVTPYLTIGIDPATGLPVNGGPFNMTSIALPASHSPLGVNTDYNTVLTTLLSHPAGGYFFKPPTAAQYAASLPIPHKVSCANPNEFNVKIKKAKAVVQVSMDMVNFIDVGEAEFGGVVELKSGSSDVPVDLMMKMSFPKPVATALAPALLAGKVNSLPAQTLPIFVSFVEMSTELEMSFLGMSQVEKDKLPLKHCGLHIANNLVTAVQQPPISLTGYLYFAIEPVTGMICENDKASVIQKMTDPAFITAEIAKYAAVAPTNKGHAHIGGGHIDDMDPLPKTTDDAIGMLDTMTGILCTVFFLLFLALLGGGLFFIKKANDNKVGDS